MLTNSGFSSGIQQRMSAGWGQSFSFPGPPRMTIEPPQDEARESNITVEGARIGIPSIPAHNVSINSNPTFSSPVYDFSSNYGNPLNLAFENQLNLQQTQQDIQTFQAQTGDYEARIAALEAWKALASTQNEQVVYDVAIVGNNLESSRRQFVFNQGLYTGRNSLANGVIATLTDCPA